ncbi:MAG: glycoside hydrolase family 172 protein [Bacteroidota bacterium]
MNIVKTAALLSGMCCLFLGNIAAQGIISAEEIWKARSYTSMRVSSYDRTGANDDGNWKNKIQPGETRTIAELEGPGIIKHMWMTIAHNEPYHLKKIILRMYWDGEENPSVEVPIGDFYGLGIGKYHVYESAYTSVGSQRALNAFFPMPFRKSAKITITSECDTPVGAFYYNIDWEKHNDLPEDALYFHAQYRQSTPTDGWTADWNRNSDKQINTHQNPVGEGNYVIMEATGKGHFLGVTHSIIQNQGDWWGEGDEMIYVDGATEPQIIGTGAEDYYLGAWCYGGCGINPFGNALPTFAFQTYGNPLNGGDDVGAQWTVYRFHKESPIPFNTAMKMTIEHGHANHRSDNYYTVGYWYQTEPHLPFPALPPVGERIPDVKDIPGPTVGKN